MRKGNGRTAILRCYLVALSIGMLALVSTCFGQEALVENKIHLKNVRVCIDESPDHSGNCDLTVLRMVQRLLSKRGSVEVNSRTMTLTVTDEKERVRHIMKVVRCYDSSI